jgi:hypothetical protein
MCVGDKGPLAGSAVQGWSTCSAKAASRPPCAHAAGVEGRRVDVDTRVMLLQHWHAGSYTRAGPRGRAQQEVM